MSKQDERNDDERENEYSALAPDRHKGTYLYRPGQLLVAEEDLDETERLLEDVLSGEKSRPVEGLRLLLLTLRPEQAYDVPQIVDRAQANAERPLRVSPHHVLTFTSHRMFAPGLPAHAVDEPDPFVVGDAGADLSVGVIDSGVVPHPVLADADVQFRDPDDIDKPLDHDGLLSFQAGHGTFVAGILLRCAPAARIIVRRVADEHGVIDDAAVAAALLALDVDVLNLSLGGYSHDDMGMMAIEAALRLRRAQSPEVIVVSAAGNHATDRPFFPAALKEVIGVGATSDGVTPACFTNHGWWVDANAPAVEVRSTFLNWDQGREAPPMIPTRCSELVDRISADQNPFQGFAAWSGTSFAAPAVAAALLRALSPKREPGSAAAAVASVIDDPSASRLPGLGTTVQVPDLTR